MRAQGVGGEGEVAGPLGARASGREEMCGVHVGAGRAGHVGKGGDGIFVIQVGWVDNLERAGGAGGHWMERGLWVWLGWKGMVGLLALGPKGAEVCLGHQGDGEEGHGEGETALLVCQGAGARAYPWWRWHCQCWPLLGAGWQVGVGGRDR